jgi:hypothetical protein
LRRAIDGLPRDTRVAMLDGIRSNDIIVGAYTGSDGICPMLAAHRRGAKTSHIAFAKAWDTFALGGARDRAARRATRRELLVLSAHLEASLLEEDAVPGLAEAIAEHRGLRDRRGDLGRVLARLERESSRVQTLVAAPVSTLTFESPPAAARGVLGPRRSSATPSVLRPCDPSPGGASRCDRTHGDDHLALSRR